MTRLVARFLILITILLSGCTSPHPNDGPDVTSEPLQSPHPAQASTSVPSFTATATAPQPATSTPDHPKVILASPASRTVTTMQIAAGITPSATIPSTTPTLTPTPAIWPTVTTQVLPEEIAAGLDPCSFRIVPDDDLLLLVSQQFGLPESYVPPNLVFLRDYFGESVTLGLGNQVQLSIIEPLKQMIEAMHAAGLKPSILSGYRSYGEQYLAWKWWNSQYPERVAIMSAKAGHSEHQLGTTVDFGSPALDHLFHVDFAKSPEGLWLRDNAHLYGFTMSYPADTYETTGFKYEPWHFRYIGVELSMELHTSGLILTEWQLAHLPPPCIPSS